MGLLIQGLVPLTDRSDGALDRCYGEGYGERVRKIDHIDPTNAETRNPISVSEEIVAGEGDNTTRGRVERACAQCNEERL